MGFMVLIFMPLSDAARQSAAAINDAFSSQLIHEIDRLRRQFHANQPGQKLPVIFAKK